MDASSERQLDGQGCRQAARHETAPPRQRPAAAHQLGRRRRSARMVACQRQAREQRGRHGLQHDDRDVRPHEQGHDTVRSPVRVGEKRRRQHHGDTARQRRQREQRRDERRPPQRHRPQPLQQEPRVRHDHQPHRHGNRLNGNHRRTRRERQVGEPHEREERPACDQRGQRKGTDGQIRSRRPQEQVERPIDAPQVEQQAQHAQRERRKAGEQGEGDDPLARRRLVRGHAGIRPEGRAHESQVEHGRDRDRPGPGPAEEQVAHRQFAEHIPSPRHCPSAAPRPDAVTAPNGNAARIAHTPLPVSHKTGALHMTGCHMRSSDTIRDATRDAGAARRTSHMRKRKRLGPSTTSSLFF